MGCHRTVARRLLAVALSLGGRTHAEKKDKIEQGMSVFQCFLISFMP